MTKRVMTKKFMKETGADKKTAMEYLRQCRWNYGRAMAMYELPERLNRFTESIKEIDWTAIMTSVAKAFEDIVANISEAMNNIDWNEEIKKIKERGESNEDTNDELLP